jgi:hypothetical protein
MVKWADMKKIPPEKSKRTEYGDLLAYPLFNSANYAGKTDAQLEKLYAEERKEELRRKQAAEKA